MSNTATPIIAGEEMKAKKYRSETEEAISTLCKEIMTLCKIIEHQGERISRLYDDVYKLFPDLDVIELMSDSAEEQQMLIDLYTNRNESFLDDLDRYKTICSEHKDKFKDDGFEIDYEETREFAMPRMQSERLREYA